MSSVRRSLLLFCLLAACAPAHKSPPPPVAPTEHAASPAPSSARASSTGGTGAFVIDSPPCAHVVRRLSAFGRGALRPQIAATTDAFAVAWEETTDHRSIRVQTFSPDARPLGSSIEVADLARAAASPRLAAAAGNDGFAIFWSSEQDSATALLMRRFDRAGKPMSDAIPVVLAPGARALAALAVEGGYALAWWNWSGTPHQISVTFVGNDGRVAGKALVLSRAPTPDPTVDLARGPALGEGALPMIAWDELAADGEHVFVAQLFRDHLEHRRDLGPGDGPHIGGGSLVWQRTDATIWDASLGGSPEMRVTDGHLPAAAPRRLGVSAFCYLRDTDPSESAHVDELLCGNLAPPMLLNPTRIAVDPRGIFGLGVAAIGERTGVAWETQQDDDTGISFAVVTCPGVAVATPRH